MAITGVNNHSTALNTIEDFTVGYRATVQKEGIIQGMQVTASGTSDVTVKKGIFAVDCGDTSLVVFRNTSDATVAVPNLGTAKYYLVVAKIDLNNATETLLAVEGTAGVDPNLTETGGVYYLPLARINAGADSTVSPSELIQDGTTVTNNATPEIIGAAANDGWLPTNETWTYASTTTHSNDVSTYSGTFTISGDKRNLYSKGMRVKYTQTTVKYGIITDISYNSTTGLTTITIFGGTDHQLANAAITANYYSREKQPQGMDLSPLKWRVVKTSSSNSTVATPVQNTWYNTISIAAPLGIFEAKYAVKARIQDTSSGASDMEVTLSTANNTESSATFSSVVIIGATTGGTTVGGGTVEKTLTLDITAAATYYVNYRTVDAGVDEIAILNGEKVGLVILTSSYL